MYAFVPPRSTICQRCSQPALQTCSVCNTSFLCDETVCQKAIIHNFTDNNKILYKILRAMGSQKTKTPCLEHTCGGTETSQSQSSGASLVSASPASEIEEEYKS